MVTKSTHKAEVIGIKLEKHPNADLLSIVKVYGYTVVVKTSDWEDGNKAVYIPPDSMLPNAEPFSFLFDGKNPRYDLTDDGMCIKKEDGQYVRITVKRFRGVYSQGLLVPAPAGMSIGEDAAPLLGIKHYEPYSSVMGGDNESPPPGGYIPKYDIESMWSFPIIFRAGELVHISEKIHGANGRWCYRNGRMWAGSHTCWKKPNEKSLWWRALKVHPEIEAFCKEYPEIVVFGEVYGEVQSLKYGLGKGEIRIAVFDLLKGGEWLSVNEARDIGENLPWVPTIAKTPYDFNEVVRLADGKSLIPGANHMREGIVVKPLQERVSQEIGRVILKVVSNAYLEQK